MQKKKKAWFPEVTILQLKVAERWSEELNFKPPHPLKNQPGTQETES